MALKIITMGNRYKVTVFCDHCNKPITDATDGDYLWQEKDPGREDDIFFTHKNCLTPFERAHPDGGYWMTGELERFVVYLAYGVDLGWAKAVESVKFISSLDL